MDSNFKGLNIESVVKDENWRFARLGRIRVGNQIGEKRAASPEFIEKCIEESRRRSIGASGLIVFVDDAPVYAELEDGVRSVVSFEPVSKNTFFEIVKLGMEPFADLHAGRDCCGGFSLNVPAGIRIEEPFVVFRWQASASTLQFPSSRVEIGENAVAKLCEFFCALPEAGETQTVARSEIRVGAGASFSRDIVQSLNETSQIFRMENVVAEESATVRGVDFCLGSGLSRTTTELCANGQAAFLNWRALNVAAGEQEIDWRTIQHHRAPGAESHVLCKNALLQRSRTIFAGNILVDKIAQQTNAVQSCRNLVLSEAAEAHALPGLEIDANDVRCSHGATTGTLDAEQLFYLLQRGLPEAEARMLLTLGFMDEVIDACAGCAVADFVREKIAEKFVADKQN